MHSMFANESNTGWALIRTAINMHFFYYLDKLFSCFHTNEGAVSLPPPETVPSLFLYVLLEVMV